MTAAEFLMAKYSNLSDIWYLSVARYPDQWLHNPVWLASLVLG